MFLIETVSCNRPSHNSIFIDFVCRSGGALIFIVNRMSGKTMVFFIHCFHVILDFHQHLFVFRICFL